MKLIYIIMFFTFFNQSLWGTETTESSYNEQLHSVMSQLSYEGLKAVFRNIVNTSRADLAQEFLNYPNITSELIEHCHDIAQKTNVKLNSLIKTAESNKFLDLLIQSKEKLSQNIEVIKIINKKYKELAEAQSSKTYLELLSNISSMDIFAVDVEQLIQTIQNASDLTYVEIKRLQIVARQYNQDIANCLTQKLKILKELRAQELKKFAAEQEEQKLSIKDVDIEKEQTIDQPKDHFKNVFKRINITINQVTDLIDEGTKINDNHEAILNQFIGKSVDTIPEAFEAIETLEDYQSKLSHLIQFSSAGLLECEKIFKLLDLSLNQLPMFYKMKTKLYLPRLSSQIEELQRNLAILKINLEETNKYIKEKNEIQ